MDTYKKEDFQNSAGLKIYTLKYLEEYQDGSSQFKVEKFETLKQIIDGRDKLFKNKSVKRSSIMLMKGKMPKLNKDPQQQIY